MKIIGMFLASLVTLGASALTALNPGVLGPTARSRPLRLACIR